MIEQFTKFFDDSIYQTFILVISTYCMKKFDKIKSMLLRFIDVTSELDRINDIFT